MSQCAAEQASRSSARWGGSRQQVRIEDFGLDPCRFKHAGKPPDAERRSQKKKVNSPQCGSYGPISNAEGGV